MMEELEIMAALSRGGRREFLCCMGRLMGRFCGEGLRGVQRRGEERGCGWRGLASIHVGSTRVRRSLY